MFLVSQYTFNAQFFAGKLGLTFRSYTFEHFFNGKLSDKYKSIFFITINGLRYIIFSYQQPSVEVSMVMLIHKSPTDASLCITVVNYKTLY